MNLIFFRIKRTTNVVLRIIPLSVALFILTQFKPVTPAYAQQGVAGYPEDQAKNIPVVTLQGAEAKKGTGLSPRASSAIPSKPLATPTSLIEVSKPLSESEAVKAIAETTENGAIPIADRSKFFFDPKTREGVATDDTGYGWNYRDVSVLRDGVLKKIPDGFVEIGRYTTDPKNGSEAKLPETRVLYGKPEGELEEWSLADNTIFINDRETKTGTLLTGDWKLLQYTDIHVVTEKAKDCTGETCVKSIDDFKVPEGYTAIGTYSRADFILPDGTTVVAKKLIYGKYDREFSPFSAAKIVT